MIVGPIEDIDAHEIRTGLGLARGELDCLVGGTPCQGFSINAPERFLEDPRNSLFRHYLRFLEEFHPRSLLFENVPGALSLENGWVVRQICEELMRLGYDVGLRILFAAHYGVAQERWRLIIIGSRIGPLPDHPKPTHYALGRANFTGSRALAFRLSDLDEPRLEKKVSVSEAIGDLPALANGEGAETAVYLHEPHSRFSKEMRGATTVLTHHVAPKLAPVNIERMKHVGPGGSWRDIPRELLPRGMTLARRSDHTKRYGRLTSDGLAGTVMTKMDPHWGAAFHYAQDRALTVREAARLQSFPDQYNFVGTRVSQYRQVGNAVPVLMAKAIALEISRSLLYQEYDLTHSGHQPRLLEESVAFGADNR